MSLKGTRYYDVIYPGDDSVLTGDVFSQLRPVMYDGNQAVNFSGTWIATIDSISIKIAHQFCALLDSLLHSLTCSKNEFHSHCHFLSFSRENDGSLSGPVYIRSSAPVQRAFTRKLSYEGNFFSPSPDLDTPTESHARAPWKLDETSWKVVTKHSTRISSPRKICVHT